MLRYESMIDSVLFQINFIFTSWILTKITTELSQINLDVVDDVMIEALWTEKKI